MATEDGLANACLLLVDDLPVNATFKVDTRQLKRMAAALQRLEVSLQSQRSAARVEREQAAALASAIARSAKATIA